MSQASSHLQSFCMNAAEPVSYAATQEDEDTAEDNEGSVMLGVILVAHDGAAVVLEAGPQPLDLPAPLVPPQRSAVLRLRFFPPASMRRTHFNPLISQPLIELVTVIRLISDQSLGLFMDKASG